MLLRRLQILAESKDLNTPGAQVVHQHGHHFIEGLPQPEHDARFGQHLGIDAFGIRERGLCRFVTVLWLHFAKNTGGTVYISVIEDFLVRLDHEAQRVQAALEIRMSILS